MEEKQRRDGLWKSQNIMSNFTMRDSENEMNYASSGCSCSCLLLMLRTCAAVSEEVVNFEGRPGVSPGLPLNTESVRYRFENKERRLQESRVETLLKIENLGRLISAVWHYFGFKR